MSRRPRAALLVLLALLLTLVPTTARAAGLAKLVDPDTSARWEEVFGTGFGTVSTENAGRIWADKSVYASADDASTAGLPVKIDVDDRSFIVGLSALASAVSVRYAVAPAPTGSRSMGMPLEDAVRNATSIEPTVLALSVPMLTTVDEEIDTMSATSSPSVMTGEPPAQMQMLAQSLTVT